MGLIFTLFIGTLSIATLIILIYEFFIKGQDGGHK
ncbi:gp48 [Listeria phage P35]|nr:gp48 [Listeria phage P35]AAY53233.1 gp48 [Listeria phage P35]